MPTLHVRSLPEDLYDELQKQARQSNRSLSAEVVDLLGDALQLRRARSQHKKALAAIRRRRFKPAHGSSSTLELLKEDRRR